MSGTRHGLLYWFLNCLYYWSRSLTCCWRSYWYWAVLVLLVCLLIPCLNPHRIAIVHSWTISSNSRLPPARFMMKRYITSTSLLNHCGQPIQYLRQLSLASKVTYFPRVSRRGVIVLCCLCSLRWHQTSTLQQRSIPSLIFAITDSL
jgi:hypothetical protein